jgi:hypothetical protein
MERRNVSRLLGLPVVLLFTAALFLPGTAFADPATAVTVEPPNQNVGRGVNFTVDIYVVPDTDIAGAQFNLSFDASVVTANNVTEGNLLKQGGASAFFTPGTIDNVAGTIIRVLGAITTSGETVSQSGIFATVSFTAKTAEGASALDLSNVIVGDPQGRAVSLTVTDGHVTIGTPPAEYTISFDTVPAATGNITFAGVGYSDGNTVNKTAATYAIVANPGSGYYFASWETTGGLSVAAPGSAITNCTVSGAGTLRMVQTTAPPEEYAITFDTVPAATGSITFAGISYSDGNTTDKTAGTYAIAAAPGSGYYFDRWETTGNLSVTSSTSATTTCEVSGAGTLRMVQTTAPPEEYTIAFDTVPAATGNVTFAGVSYGDEDTVDKTAGTYVIASGPGNGYYFDRWETTGNLSVTSSTSATTTCEVSGAGTLRMAQTTAAPEEYAIAFDTVPAAIGSITFDGVSYSDGNTVNKTAGTYAITAAPGSGYYFASWQTTGSLSVAAPGSAATNCVVSGAGTLRMVQTTTAPPVNGTDHPISKTAILGLSIAVGAAIVAGTILLVRRHRSAIR